VNRNILSNAHFFANTRLKKPRPPLKTFDEMAQEFGVTPHKLRAALAHSETTPPSPLFKYAKPKSGKGKGNTWYSPDPLRAWWKQHLNKLNTCS